MRLPVSVTDILSRTVSEFSSLLLKFWILCVFETTLRGLRTTYGVYLGLIGKRLVDFLLELSELYSLGVMAESLRAKR